MTYRDNAGRKGKSTDQPIWEYYSDIHPKTEEQFNNQQFLAGIFSNYGAWMRGRSTTERNMNTRELYSVAFEDITYPWLSDITAANEYRALGSGAWEFSRNVVSLYKGAVRSGKRAEESRKRSIRAQLAREARERRYRYHRNYRW